MSSFRWGILGAGVVARRFAAGLAAARNEAKVLRVASRRPEHAADFAAALGAEPQSYAAVCGAHDIDAVYIATPPVAHEELAVACIEAGLPVLVEKPFAMDAAAAWRIADAARANKVFAMEAMWTRFLPLFSEMRARIRGGDLGELRSFAGGFAIAEVPSPSDNRFDPASGGGALMQRGVYPLSVACHLLGPAAEISGFARVGELGVDEDVMATARHEGGAISTIHASLVTQARNDGVLMGTAGWIEIEGPIYRPFAMRLRKFEPRSGAPSADESGRLSALRDSQVAHRAQQHLAGVRRLVMPHGRRIVKPYDGNGYGHEADAVMDAVREGRTEHPLMPLAESVHVMELIDQVKGRQ